MSRGQAWKMGVVLATLALGAALLAFRFHRPAGPFPGESGKQPARIDPAPYLAALSETLAAYRQLIVLFADEPSLSPTEREAADRVGHEIFHDNLERSADLERSLAGLAASPEPKRFETLATVLDWVESGEGLFDADRLAFREILRGLQGTVAVDTTLPAIRLHQRLGEDLAALAEIERRYEKEVGPIFGRFAPRAIPQKRERWNDYVAHLKTIYSRERLLKDHGVVLPSPQASLQKVEGRQEKEIFGLRLPPKTVVLTFDDGPHSTYSEEIAAILQQYGAPAVFFEVGRNLGSVDAGGVAHLGPRAGTSRRLLKEGFVLANHSYSHSQLSKLTGEPLRAEIVQTDILLKAVDAGRSALFRFPYGARNPEGLQILDELRLRSVLWNIDSLDWADPVPSSIADRVLRLLDQQGRGIILFHDIHERAVKALPLVLDRLLADDYRFAAWDGQAFEVAKAAPAPAAEARLTTGYGESWAIVVGIDDYAKWPKLHYAVRDAEAVAKVLVDKFGFAAQHVFALENAAATRAAILGLFEDKLGHGALKRDDRVFVFFAGHGATRSLSSGRNLGYVIPADSDPQHVSADAVPMTEIQNLAESLEAKHVLFVMDACYSGLGLTRGERSGQFLSENARRIGRQMLTAGGADQMVADGGPNGHSVFTWTLLQGLAGKGDLNGDGFITATELAAYVAPAVASVTSQTPAFGSLPGSEGGEFVFVLPGENEFLSAQTAQLSPEAIALNGKLEASPGGSLAPVTIPDLQGKEQKIAPPAPVTTSARQLAQRANDRGLQLYKEKQYDAAEDQFTEALKLRSDFALAANNLGFVFFKQGKYREAARWFENALHMDPSRAIAYLNLGDARRLGGEHEKAVAAYRMYLALAPHGPGAQQAKQHLEAGQ
ncbi:MAG TPA: polysaccharide deacetylase family protein [Thermoanaerobaculia bacterium]|nr:polysaccharide deacetylase family protein [Thermoanaerobaculia bacterium]